MTYEPSSSNRVLMVALQLPRKCRDVLGRAVTKNYKLVKLRQECYQSTIAPL